MRWIFLWLGIASFIVGAFAFYLGTQQPSEDTSQVAIREALKTQSKSISTEMEAHLDQHSKKIYDFIQNHSLKKGKILPPTMFEPIYISWKQADTMQEWKAKNGFSPYVKTTAASLFQSLEKITYGEDKDKKSYIFLSLRFADTVVVSAYKQEQFFSRFRLGSALSLWVALKSGDIIFHSNTRYLGTAAGNVRPVALGGDNLRQGMRSEMMAQYVGLDGKKILGAWSTIPEWGITVGNEWPSIEGKNSKISIISWLAFLGLVLGAFFIGVSIVPAPIHVTAAQKEIKDLSHEARAFIKKAEKQAEKAYEYAKEREQELSLLEGKAREQLAYAERTRWIFEHTENFLEEIIDAKDESIVWPTLATYLSAMALKSPVLIYTYSASSCSLIPQCQEGIQNLPDSAKRYFQEARILVGDIQNIHKLETTVAYQTWYERLQKFAPLDTQNLFVMPFASSTGTRGIVLFLFNSEHIKSSEIEKQRDLWELFAFRAAWLYDMKKRLLQSKYGKKSRSDTLAFPSNRSRDQFKST